MSVTLIYRKLGLHKTAITIVLALLILFQITVPANGEEPVAFSVKAIIPENQIDSSISYFDLGMEPKQTQTILVEIGNANNTSIKAYVNVNNASTGTNGTMIYSKAGIVDASLAIPIEEIATVENPEISIGPNSKEYARISITMPEDAFDGVVLGGIYITAESEEEPIEESTEEQGTGITLENRLAYILGLKLSENDNPVEPNMNLLEISPKVIGLEPVVAVRLQNSEPVIMKGIAIHGEVYEKGSTDVLKEISLLSADAAPNSSFDVAIGWDGKKIQPGTYRMKMTAEYQGYVWEWDEEFHISAGEVHEVNESAVEEDEVSFVFWPLIIILFLILLIVAFLLGRKTRREESREEERENVAQDDEGSL